MVFAYQSVIEGKLCLETLLHITCPVIAAKGKSYSNRLCFTEFLTILSVLQALHVV